MKTLDEILNLVFQNNTKSLDDIICEKGYFINKDGEVYSTKSDRWLKLNHNTEKWAKQYMYPELIVKGKHYKINRLMIQAWKGEIPDNYQVHHIDRNILNNKLSNLQCLSYEEHRNIHMKS